MGFEEFRKQLNYLHKRRDYSKRKTRFEIIDDQENFSSNRMRTSSENKNDSKRSGSSSLRAKEGRVSNIVLSQGLLYAYRKTKV